MTRFTKTLRIAVTAVALGTVGFAATSLTTASDAAAWEGPGNFKNPGKGGGGGGNWGGPGGFKNPGKGGGGGGAWNPPKGPHHPHHGHGGWGKGYGYGYGAGLVLGAVSAIPVIVDAPDCYVVVTKKFIPGVGKVKERMTVCD